MNKNLSLAVLALLGLVSVDALSMTQRARLDIDTDLEEASQALTEETRYVDSQGNFVNLAQTNHARLVLSQVKKDPVPVEQTYIMTEECFTNLAESQTTKDSMGRLVDVVTHCPVNEDGKPHEVSIKQMNLDDNAYVSEMYVGNPPQKIRALFDTGSTNTWILNSKTQLAGNANKELSFDSEKSSTFKKTQQAAMIQFGSGALAGHFVTDDIRLGTCDGQKSTGQIHIKDQKFGNVEKQSTIFTGSNFEAIVGLAYPSLAEKGVTPVFDEMMNQKLVPNNLFAFYLTSKQAEGMGMPSDLTFGFYDRSKFKGDIDWHPVDYQYMFGVKLDDILFNGQSSGVCADRPNGCLITFDSGTSLMSVPSFATKKLVKSKIPTSNFIQPCQNKEQFGDMTLVIGGKNYVVPNDEWMLPQQTLSMAQTQAKLKTTLKMGPLGPQLMAQTNSEVSLGSEEEHKPDQDVHLQTEADADRHNRKSPSGGANIKPGDTACASTIMNMDLSKDMFLVGDVFMRRFYTIFDRDNNRVGIAQAVTNDKIKLASQGGMA